MSGRAFLLAFGLLGLQLASAQNSAVITLVMPVGARQLGMGEASVGLADDAFATYWNPAGLAFGPLSDEWDVALPVSKMGSPFVGAMAAVPRAGLFSRGDVWVGNGAGLWRWNGRGWSSTHDLALELGSTAEASLRRWMGNLWPLDTLLQGSILRQVYLASGATNLEEVKELVTLKVPYSILVRDTVRCAVVDATGKLWVGTDGGLIRFDGRSWTLWNSASGSLPSPRVTALSALGATVWIGTDSGLVRVRQKESEFDFRRFGEAFGLASQNVSALAAEERNGKRIVWVGTRGGGISKLELTRDSSTWRSYTTTDGLVSDSVIGVALDPEGIPWVAHSGGVSHLKGNLWERLVFKGTRLTSIAIDKKRQIWLGSDKGAGKFVSREAVKKTSGGRDDAPPEGTWTHYHAGNGLAANDAAQVVVQGEDVWFATSKGIVRFRDAHAQMGGFYETLLPALGLKDLFHMFATATFPVEDWGTIGGNINFISFGENTFVNATTQEEQKFQSYEAVGTVSYGTRLTRQWGLGVNLKFIYSALAPGIKLSEKKEDGVAVSYAFDVAALRKDLFVRGLNLGFMAQNVGPAVYYISRNQSDPVPLTYKAGLSYKVLNHPVHSLTLAADYSRETVSRDPKTEGTPRNFLMGTYYGIAEPWGEGKAPAGSDWGSIAKKNLDESIYNLGFEYVYSGALAIRSGLLFDPGGKRQELDFGAGVTLSDLMQIDYAYIKDIGWIGSNPDGIREGQSRFSLTVLF